MYLSKLILDSHSRRVQREVAEPYKMHRSLMQGFPSGLTEGDERVLFRVEQELNAALILLVQSWLVPDWSWLAEPQARGYLLAVSQPNPAVKAFDLNTSLGQVLAFRLRANPTMRRKYEDGKRRVGIYGEQEQIEWLRRKALQGGFQLLSVRCTEQDDVQGKIPDEGKVHEAKFAAVQFDGLLQVTDPAVLRETVRHGIGSAKGLGFGLLSLARAPGA